VRAPDPGIHGRTLVELVEGAARSGHRATAVAGVEKLAMTAPQSETDWAAASRQVPCTDTDDSSPEEPYPESRTT